MQHNHYMTVAKENGVIIVSELGEKTLLGVANDLDQLVVGSTWGVLTFVHVPVKDNVTLLYESPECIWRKVE